MPDVLSFLFLAISLPYYKSDCITRLPSVPLIEGGAFFLFFKFNKDTLNDLAVNARASGYYCGTWLTQPKTAVQAPGIGLGENLYQQPTSAIEVSAARFKERRSEFRKKDRLGLGLTASPVAQQCMEAKLRTSALNFVALKQER